MRIKTQQNLKKKKNITMLRVRDKWRQMETNGCPFVSHLLLNLATTNGWMSIRHKIHLSLLDLSVMFDDGRK